MSYGGRPCFYVCRSPDVTPPLDGGPRTVLALVCLGHASALVTLSDIVAAVRWTLVVVFRC